jgi:hypothetical protein
MIKPILEYKITSHGEIELKRRGITEEQVRQILHDPGQRKNVREGREMLQSKIEERGKEYLLRIFVDTDRKPSEVVTGYKTSKIKKYWESHA